MKADTKVRASSSDTGDRPDMHHYYCCDEDKALCGEDIRGVPENDGEGEQMCVVCDDLEEVPCPVCGD